MLLKPWAFWLVPASKGRVIVTDELTPLGPPWPHPPPLELPRECIGCHVLGLAVGDGGSGPAVLKKTQSAPRMVWVWLLESSVQFTTHLPPSLPPTWVCMASPWGHDIQSYKDISHTL